MGIFGDRAQALQRRKFTKVEGFLEKMYLEKVSYASSDSPFFKGAETVDWSVLIDPPPIIKVVTEEDLATYGRDNLSMGDYIVEALGSAIPEATLRETKRIYIGEIGDLGEHPGRFLQVLFYRAGDWPQISGRELSIMGQVQFWHVFVRGQVQK